MPRFILYGGKGGVGKTSCAAATALGLADKGHETLIVSTDPAHSLSDVYREEVGWEEREIRENLWAVEIDPERALEQWQSELKLKSEDMPGPIGESVGELLGTEPLSAPGMDEAAAMDRFMRYMESDYDYVVLDTAPTGHTLRLLELPEFLDTMTGRLIKVRMKLGGMVDGVKNLLGGGEKEEPKESDVERLEKVKQRVDRARSLLMDPEKTEFRIVMIPEAMSIEESRRLVKSLEEYQIPVRTVVVNKVIQEPEDCDFCRARAETQWKRLKEAHESFRGLDIIELPLYPHEVHGMEPLERMAEDLTENLD